MVSQISAVINTLDDEKNLARVLKSLSWCNEILICDMHSSDKTVEIAKKLGARIIYHKREQFVEPARNFAIAEAADEWILIVDPDEEIGEELKNRLIEISSKMKQINFVRIPRKNIIFGKWMKQSMWWPDLNIRFFKKGKVKWGDKIHRPPEAFGDGISLEEVEKYAIIHHHYDSIPQFLGRMIRYTRVQADELIRGGYRFDWKDLIKKPLAEFLSRFFASKGYEDGLHGLVLSLLQSFSFLIVYLHVWEAEKFSQSNIDLRELKEVTKQSEKEIDYWFKFSNLSKNSFKRFFQRLRNI